MSSDPNASASAESQQGSGLSAREVAGLYRNIKSGNISEEQVDRVLSQIPDETKQQAVATAFNEYLVPHFADVRQRATSDVSHQQVRERYSQFGDEKQQEIFNRAVSDVIGTLFELRANPAEGAMTLKGLLRDPFTIEGLLLIFDNDEHIDPSYSDQMKDFAAMHLRWAGVALMPEAYDQETVVEVSEQIGLDIDPEKVERRE